MSVKDKTQLDVTKLKGTIVLRGFNQERIIDKTDISRNRFYKALNGQVEFTRSEIAALIDELGLSDDEIMDIFFREKVS